MGHPEPSIRREVVTVLATMSNSIGPAFALNYLQSLRVQDRKLIDTFSKKARLTAIDQ